MPKEQSTRPPIPSLIRHWTLDTTGPAHGYFLATNSLFMNLVSCWTDLPLPLSPPSSTPLLSLQTLGHTNGQSTSA